MNTPRWCVCAYVYVRDPQVSPEFRRVDAFDPPDDPGEEVSVRGGGECEGEGPVRV